MPPVDAGSIFSEVRVRLDKLSGDIKSINAEFDKVEAKEKAVNKTVQADFEKTSMNGVKAFGTINQSIKSTIITAETFAKTMQNAGGKMTTFVSLPLLGVGAAMVKTASDMEMFQVSFETLLQSTDKAKVMIADLKDFAAKTPFGFEDLAQSAKTMLGFGIASEQIMPNLRMLGDIAQGNKEKLGSLTLAFSQIQSTGRLMGQDLLQLINAGFNPLTIISEKTGRSMAALKKDMEGGAISADMVAEAFKTATSEGGRFFGGMEKASQTTAGKWSTLLDDGKALLVDFGNLLLPFIKDVMAGASNLIKWFQGLDDSTKKMILTVGGIAIVAGPVITAIGGIASALITLGPLLPAIIAIGAGIAVIGGGVAVVNGLAHGFDTLYDAAKRENDITRQQIARYEELKNKANLSNQELAEMEAIKNRLIELDPSLKAGIDENTGALNLNEEALRKVNLQMLEKEKLALESQKKQNTAEVEKRLEAIKKESLWSLMTADEQKERLETDIQLGNSKQKQLFTDKQILETNQKIKEIMSTMPTPQKPSVAATPSRSTGGGTAAPVSVEDIDVDAMRARVVAQQELNNGLQQYVGMLQEVADDNAKISEDEAKRTAELKKQTEQMEKMVESIKSQVPTAISSISGLFSALYDQRMKELDNQLKAELEAAGVAELTAVERARKELDEAKKGGDKQVIAEKEKSLKRAQIEEEYQKKKAALELEAAHTKWKLDMASAVWQAAIMVINAWNSALFPFNLPALALAGIIGGTQIAAVAAAEPKFESGGIVAGDQYSGDHIRARVNSKEMILTQEQQARLFALANGAGKGGDINMVNNWGGVYSNPDFDRYTTRLGKKVEAARRSRG